MTEPKFTPGPWKSETIRYKDGDMFVRITTAYDDYDADDCMMWRWTNAEHTDGYCGLAGKEGAE